MIHAPAQQMIEEVRDASFDASLWRSLALNTEGMKVAVAGYYVTGSPDQTPPTYPILPVATPPTDTPPVKPLNNPPATPAPDAPTQKPDPAADPGNNPPASGSDSQPTSADAATAGAQGNASSAASGGPSSGLGSVLGTLGGYAASIFTAIDSARRAVLGALDGGVRWAHGALGQTESSSNPKSLSVAAFAGVALAVLVASSYVVGSPWVFYPALLGIVLLLTLGVAIRRHQAAEVSEPEADPQLSEF